MKIKSILALTVLSFCIGIANYSKAQDTKPSFFGYLFKTPWIVDGGFSIANNGGSQKPLDFNFKTQYYGASRTVFFPLRFSVEKRLFAFSSNNFLKGFGLQGTITDQGFNPINFGAIDGNVKYHFNVLLSEDSKLKKWFDPYLLVGLGITEILYDDIKLDNPNNSYTAPYLPPVKQLFSRDRFGTLNSGIGCNFWINEVVGINLQADARWGKFIERDIRNLKTQGTNYTQYSVGLVFKIGRCKKEEAKVEAPKPASNYKRSKEEEDALIHLREHLNK